MHEDLILFETAKLARDKGFDIPCFYAYGESEDKIYNALDFKTFNVFDTVRYFSNTNNCYIDKHDIDYYQVLYTLCPTQSHLQKWLREVHNIHIEVASNFVTIDAFEKHRNWYVYMQDEEIEALFDSYEQALETGLFQALKLIK